MVSVARNVISCVQRCKWSQDWSLQWYKCSISYIAYQAFKLCHWQWNDNDHLGESAVTPWEGRPSLGHGLWTLNKNTWGLEKEEGIYSIGKAEEVNWVSKVTQLMKWPGGAGTGIASPWPQYILGRIVFLSLQYKASNLACKVSLRWFAHLFARWRSDCT